MYNRKLNIIPLGLLFLLTIIVSSIAETWAAGKEEQQVTVAVKKLPYGLTINPVKVKRGEPVIWVNHDAEPMKIKILTKVAFACIPVNFYADLLGYFESILIGKHMVASFCFIDKGEYKYEVRRSIKVGDKVEEETLPGKVIVE
jgi:plastocyanin